MKSDADVKHDVDAELKWNPQIDATDIATKVTNGAVALSGYARNYYERHQAELSVKRVAGVTAVANDLLVKSANPDKLTDPEIAREALSALKMELPASWDKIRPMVRDGQVVLEGVVEWQYLRDRAEGAMHRVRGLRGVRNSIRVQPAIAAGEIKSRIEAAFRRSAVIDADHVKVEVHGSEVRLTGEVRSWAEREQAKQSAWSAPGVANVVDDLTVRA